MSDGLDDYDMGYHYTILNKQNVSKEKSLYCFFKNINNISHFYNWIKESDFIPDNIDPSNYILHLWTLKTPTLLI